MGKGLLRWLLRQLICFGRLTVNFATADAGAVSSGPLPNYVATNGILTFDPGEVSKSLNVTILDDGAFDPPIDSFFFTVNLSGLTPVDSKSAATARQRGDVLLNRKLPVSVSSAAYSPRAMTGVMSRFSTRARSYTSSPVAHAVTSVTTMVPAGSLDSM